MANHGSRHWTHSTLAPLIKVVIHAQLQFGLRLGMMMQAQYRWALSGTPIQNQVQELFSYFHFLQYHPFNTKAAFDKYMRNVEDLDNPTHALERLREVLQPIMLRRTKASTFEGNPILTLPLK